MEKMYAKMIRSKSRQVEHQRWLMLKRKSLQLVAQMRKAALGGLASLGPRAFTAF
jgi:hypothetical protein